MRAWALENEFLRTVVVPELGAKVVSLLDKRSQREWLVGPGGRALKTVPYGAPFQEQDMSGWDEMFPTIVACAYPGPGDRHGTPLPDHGEVWTLPWTVDQAGDGRLTLRVEGRALPYRLTRTAEYSAPATLQLHYQLVNLGQERMPYIWAAHPQFACGPDAEIIFPPQVTEVCNTIPESWGWGAPETRFAWPAALAPNGDRCTSIALVRLLCSADASFSCSRTSAPGGQGWCASRRAIGCAWSGMRTLFPIWDCGSMKVR